MGSKALILGLLILGAIGCKDENSPEMGAVPPKPDPNIASKMPPELRQKMQNAKSSMDAQNREMGQMAKNAHAAGK